jgi:glycosyltransferase involved in cell wall biosynthesis
MDALLWPYFRSARFALANATAIVAINDGFVEWGLKRGGRARSQFDRTFPMAYPTSDPPQEEQARARDFWLKQGLTRSDDGTLRVCFFGTLGRQFEFEPVIEAARALSSARVQFVICGTGDRFDDVRNQLRDLPNVLMPGWVGAPEIWMLMRLSHIGLAPYHDEESFTHSLPNKSLEYLSAGLPIVSSLPGALARLLDEQQCGITYPNRDAAALQAALERVRDDPAMRVAMARKAKTIFDARFRADVVYADFVTHLEAVAGSRR